MAPPQIPANSVPATRSEATRAHDLSLGFGHPQFHSVTERQTTEKRLCQPICTGAIEDQVLHRGHGPNVVFLCDVAQRDPVGKGCVGVEQGRSPDHDRLRFLRLESILEERLVESGGTIMTAGLPFDPGDLGVVTEVVEGVCHDRRDGLGVGAVEVRIGYETFSPSERHQKKRAEVGHPDGALVSASVRNCRS